MKIEKNKDLKSLNTFGVQQFCDNFIIFEKKEELKDFHFDENTLILGGGSNIILLNKPKNVVKLSFDKIQIIENNKNFVVLKADAGLEWDKLVEYCVEKEFWGIENMSAIPGTVGASPIQNIGAYGIELKDVLQSVDYYDIETKTFKTIENKYCEFDYRNSIFKKQLKKQNSKNNNSLKTKKNSKKKKK